MPYRSDIAYVYDGSFEGLLCCVYESYYCKELPFAIFDYSEEQRAIFAIKEILTDPEKAKRVGDSIVEKISGEALELVQLSYLSKLENRELAVLNFLRLGYKVGRQVTGMLVHDAVTPIIKSAQTVKAEAHIFKGFTRFGDYNGALVAIIEPKCFILPVIAPYFCDRMPSEQFLIYDKTHKHAFIQHEGKRELLPLEHLELPEASDEELMFRALWKQFYNTIAIESRINPKLRINNLPKRYWMYLPELH